MIAAAHGFGAAWLAIWMLFHPYRPVKLWGVTVWPQGMIPRHRDKLAESIGNAVGNELVSQDTIIEALFGREFFRRKVEGFVGEYSRGLLETNYPSFVEALPQAARAPVLDAVSALQYRLAEHITGILKSEETAAAVSQFVERRTDELLSRRVKDVVGDDAFERILGFVEERFRGLVTEATFESKIRDFVSARLEEIANSRATLAEVFTPDTVALIKSRIDEQVPPVVRHLAELATSQQTRQQIGGLIKREVDDYYNQLSLLKKFFISRDRIYKEVDEMVNSTLPRRVEEFLRGEAFEARAEQFLDETIDDVLARPVNELVGQIEPDKLQMIKDQVSGRVLAIARSPELATSVSAYATDALQRLRPHSLRALLQHLNPESAAQIKTLLTKQLLALLRRDETAQSVNHILSAQIERLLVTPIGRPADYLPEESVRKASAALTERITLAARERLPAAIAEFDVGGIVREKVAGYPVEKLEALILSVAQQHLKKIEIFGAVIGLILGIIQAIIYWFAPGFKI